MMQPKIKVAFFSETLKENYDGAVRTMYQIIGRIPQDRFEFIFICGDDIIAPLPFRTIVLSALTIPFNSRYRMTIPSFSREWLINQLEEFQPDILHIATPSLLGHFALNYAKQRHLPVISIYHTHFLSYVDYYLKNIPFLIEPVRKIMAKNSKAFYDNCDIVYVPTTEMVDDLAGFGHQTEHLKLWQRGIDHKLFHPSKSNKVALHQHTGNTKPNILFASRLVWEKNLDTLIGLYRLNEINGCPYNILVAGDGVAKKELTEQMPNALFYGELNHEALAVLYASSDVFFFPSITETYGNVVIEAMASGLPCVIANGGGSKSFITQGVNGFLCDPTNAQDYFDKITQLLAHPNLYKQFIEEGLTYTQTLNWEHLVEVYFQDVALLANKVAPTTYMRTA